MQEIKGTIFKRVEGGVVVAMPYSIKCTFKTQAKYELGSVVWVAYNFTNRTITSINPHRLQAGDSHNETPAPPVGEPDQSPTEILPPKARCLDEDLKEWGRILGGEWLNTMLKKEEEDLYE